MNEKTPGTGPAQAEAPLAELPGKVVLVLQGGGALGAYQVGVYQALHEAGLEPEWVIGTSIGAINGAIIAGNPPEQRLSRLRQFWDSVAYRAAALGSSGFRQLEDWLRVVNITTRGIPSFFTPSPDAWWPGVHASVGLARAAFYSTSPLRATLKGNASRPTYRNCSAGDAGPPCTWSNSMRRNSTATTCTAISTSLPAGSSAAGWPATRTRDACWSVPHGAIHWTRSRGLPCIGCSAQHHRLPDAATRPGW
ncbi:hypothetical protein LMG26411_06835 [Cupriavidus numazuensis]|uniref:PNPLA domain-containing protein n=1 Tax=Cupriavidus numazuensis TaxID=221992 RepID=A0ABM8TTE8_9BURK|nr:hypothetical protein LMG26411_06835 [Cupriavidus numazuensis]